MDELKAEFEPLTKMKEILSDKVDEILVTSLSPTLPCELMTPEVVIFPSDRKQSNALVSGPEFFTLFSPSSSRSSSLSSASASAPSASPSASPSSVPSASPSASAPSASPSASPSAHPCPPGPSAASPSVPRLPLPLPLAFSAPSASLPLSTTKKTREPRKQGNQENKEKQETQRKPSQVVRGELKSRKSNRMEK